MSAAICFVAPRSVEIVMLARPAAVVPLTPERAREEFAQWPEWKQRHALTKHSAAVHLGIDAAAPSDFRFPSSPALPSSAPAKFASGATPTMSSREIAELTGKDLSNVHRDIRAMLQALSVGDASVLNHVREVKDARGYASEICLPKDLTITLVSGYNVTMRHRIVTRWMELEAAQPPQAFKLPQSFAEALRLAADLQEANEKLGVKPQKISGNI